MNNRGRYGLELLRRIRIGMTRAQVVAALGAPTDTGCKSRKYKTPAIYKYGNIELHFEPWKAGRLVRAYTEDAQGNGRTLLE
jgi:hypothetical protein